MFYHRGSWVSDAGIKSVSDMFRSNNSDYGTTTMSGEKTSSWQRFYPPGEEKKSSYGYDCSQFARDAAYKGKGRTPVIVEFQISDEKTYNKYSQYLKLVLKRGHETDITSHHTLVGFTAVLVDASTFSYDEFLKYRGELLINDKIAEAGISGVEDLRLALYKPGHSYIEFVNAYNEGRVKPLYKTEDITREILLNSVEGNQELNTH